MKAIALACGPHHETVTATGPDDAAELTGVCSRGCVLTYRQGTYNPHKPAQSALSDEELGLAPADEEAAIDAAPDTITQEQIERLAELREKPYDELTEVEQDELAALAALETDALS